MMRKFGLVALAAGLLLLAPVVPQGQESSSETYRQLNLFGEVFERVRSDYVEETRDSELIETAINGMLTSLDPHSSYLNADSYRDMQVQTKGEFGGLGIEVTMEEGFVKVVSPIDDTPAFRAGIQPGDFITHLDGESVLGLTLTEAVEKMRGPVNTKIRLTIRREGTEPIDLSITRAVIHIQSVRWRMEGDIGYIRVTAFNEQTEAGLGDAIAQIRGGAKNGLKGVVLDLRNNPGGLLDQAVAAADVFLDKGEIVSTRGRRPEAGQRFNARAGDMLAGLPVVVMINGGSASASEIVAGALQDHRRAILLGTPTFGKGSVQTIIPLGNQGAMRLTTALYFTPSGQSIQAKGIEPDIYVEPARIEPIAMAERRREADLRGALANGDGVPPGAAEAAPEEEPEAEAEGGAEATAVEEDYQLSRALDLLRGLSLFSARATN
jgi:carboxyl-terminal processing protease